jgi:hypothetical protein
VGKCGQFLAQRIGWETGNKSKYPGVCQKPLTVRDKKQLPLWTVSVLVCNNGGEERKKEREGEEREKNAGHGNVS